MLTEINSNQCFQALQKLLLTLILYRSGAPEDTHLSPSSRTPTLHTGYLQVSPRFPFPWEPATLSPSHLCSTSQQTLEVL